MTARQGDESHLFRAIYAVITGAVQGVGFRYTTRAMANQMGLTGWVRNRSDGSVEVWAQGPPDAVARFTAFLERGPRAARVTSLNLEEVDPDPAINGFRVEF
jgi:acylphosphatase